MATLHIADICVLVLFGFIITLKTHFKAGASVQEIEIMAGAWIQTENGN